MDSLKLCIMVIMYIFLKLQRLKSFTIGLSLTVLCNVICLCCCNDDVTTVVFGADCISKSNVMPAAFGDFNSDELIDLFLIRDKYTVEVLLGSTVEPFFKQSELKCTFLNHSVTSIVPGDFDGDALMDILVTTVNKSNLGITNVYLIWGGLDRLNCAHVDNPIFKMRDEPLAIDYTRNMTIDLFGVNENGDRGFWIFKPNRTKFEWKPMFNASGFPKIRKPHSHAFLDLNNDNSPDLFVTAIDRNEIWLWNNDLSDFVFNSFIPYPENLSYEKIGQTLFLDVEIANKIDHIVPVCFEKVNYYCKNSTIYVYSNDHWYNLNVNFQDPANKLWGFSYQGISYTDAVTLRGGDYNMDGYPDILVTLIKIDDGAHRSVLLENIACETKCEGFTRTFKIQWDAFGRTNENTVLGVFYDFFQDGILDIIFVHAPSVKSSHFHISAFKNDLDYDANFIKVMVITGLTNNKITLPLTVLGAKRYTFGTNMPGPKISYKTFNQEGEPRTGKSTQLPQSAHFALCLPYTIFGLGRTPNFVEDLKIGIFNHSRTWTQIIPNSQLVVIPFPADEPYKWRAQLFVTPSKIILQTVVALLGTCIVILIVISILQWKERRVDKIEKESYKFNFDAM